MPHPHRRASDPPFVDHEHAREEDRQALGDAAVRAIRRRGSVRQRVGPLASLLLRTLEAEANSP